ncbi:MAG: outer membrane beta-barrel protein [bacterium]|nr:outer membrane beta-barrel protein [bacterium]
MKKWILLFLAFSVTASAQPQFQAGGGFSLAYPQKDFKENVDNIGIGGTGHFAYRMGQSPFLVGFAAGFWIYGSETYETPLISSVPVWVDVTTTNSIMAFDLFLRVQPQSGPVRPYVDLLGGFNLLSTSTSIEDQGWDDDDDIASSNNFNDAAWGWGFGGGLMFRVYNGVARGRQDGLDAVYVDLGVRSMRGGEAEYLKEGSIEALDNGRFKYDVKRSETDMVTWHLGVNFDFTVNGSSGR